MKLNALVAGAAIALVTAFAAVSANAATLYDNHGPSSDSVNAWTIDPPFAVADSFSLAQNSTLTGVHFDGWNNPQQTATSVDWSILDGSPADAGTHTLFSGTGALSAAQIGLGMSFYTITDYGFSLPSLTLGGGTYWLQLANAQGADITYWDESDGASLAYQTDTGPIGSHTFTIEGVAGGVPEPASWALMLSGFLGAGSMLRASRRRTAVATA